MTGQQSEAAAGVVVPAAERGSLRIADRVVAKVAAQAAGEALRTGPDAHKLPGGKRGAPQANVNVRDGSARVRLSLALGYPSDIAAQCLAVRRHVASRVRELVGMEVPEVAVGVDRLHTAQRETAALGRVR